MKTDRINRIKVVLAEQNKTGKWLAEQLQKNEATVSRWCSNTSQPSLEVLTRIAEILNMSLEDVIGLNKQKFSICGFIKINEDIHEISSKDDIESCLSKIRSLESGE